MSHEGVLLHRGQQQTVSVRVAAEFLGPGSSDAVGAWSEQTFIVAVARGHPAGSPELTKVLSAKDASSDGASSSNSSSRASTSSSSSSSSSSYPFFNRKTWLSKEVGPGFFQSFVVGDFPAQEARGFLDECLQQVGKPGVVDADWEAVQKVCGGNAGALVRAAGSYNSLGGWKAALSQAWWDRKGGKPSKRQAAAARGAAEHKAMPTRFYTNLLLLLFWQAQLMVALTQLNTHMLASKAAGAPNWFHPGSLTSGGAWHGLLHDQLPLQEGQAQQAAAAAREAPEHKTMPSRFYTNALLMLFWQAQLMAALTHLK
ncbi:hypothetical protein OEZ85_003918 [Tetradesmus obliquus]|uniref:VASt domain-containing protein n=1 Tax=Tetradesmus obliquus TaxID=3088 RepID=A0ABY8UF63_TETOB|nr:hypothetical protein OEZ85_003918 [Tetradesmus obliquus]